MKGLNYIRVTLKGNFSPLRFPSLRLYLGGQAISLIGTWLQATAQSWVVWQLTGSEAALGLVNVFNALPVLLFSLFAGVWVDRLDRRRLLIATQLVAMLLAFILAVLVQSKVVQVWHIYLLSLSLGTVNALDMPAQQAFLADLSVVTEVRKAINLNATIIQVSRIVGPALAGLVVAHLGIAPAFWLNGLSFLAVIASLLALRARPRTGGSGKGSRAARQMVEGLVYVRSNRRVQDLFLFAILMTFFFQSIVFNLLPAVTTNLPGGNPETLGWLLASSGAGALVAVLIIVPLTQALQHVGLVMLGTLFWIGVWLSLFAHSHSLPFSLVAFFMASLGGPTIMTMTMGLVQVMSPPEMRGRMGSLFSMTTFGVQPVAALWIGQIAQFLGVETAIQLNAILLGLGAAGMLLRRPVTLRFKYPPAVLNPKSQAIETPDY